jgi:hypothetical protein
MNIHLLDPSLIIPGIGNLQKKCYEELITLAQLAKPQGFSVVDTADEADVIIAAIQSNGYGVFMEHLKSSTVYRHHKHKIYLYSLDDNAYPFLPGIYPATLTQWVEPGWTLGGHYISAHIHKHHFQPESSRRDRQYLFSFIGSSNTNLIREVILKIEHPRAFLFDSNPAKDQNPWWEKADSEMLLQQYRESMLNTKFALCPKGVSPSSIRLFEAMEAGCVPVVIADQLVLPEGPSWSDFLIKIPEAELQALPGILTAAEPKFEVMSQLSRQAWQDYFSPQATLNSLVSWCIKLHQGLTTTGKRDVLQGQMIRQSWLNLTLNKARVRSVINQLQILVKN